MPIPTSLFAFTDWTALATPGVGILVAVLVPLAVFLVGRLRRKPSAVEGSKEEDLSWEDLLEYLRRNKDRKDGQGPDLPANATLEQLLAQMPPLPRRAAAGPAEEPMVPVSGGMERRTGRRRWGNPTEVYVSSTLWPGCVHGLVVNRSTGGLAIFLDREAPVEAVIKVRSAEAPASVPPIEAEVRHCRKAGKSFLIGCEFAEEIPWNVRVWFG
jgi:hypothetical protein